MAFPGHKNTKSLLASILFFCPVGCMYHKPLYINLQKDCMYVVCSAFLPIQWNGYKPQKNVYYLSKIFSTINLFVSTQNSCKKSKLIFKDFTA